LPAEQALLFQLFKAPDNLEQVQIFDALEASLSNSVSGQSVLSFLFCFQRLKMARGELIWLDRIAITSSGMAGVLLEVGATARSCFKIPFDAYEQEVFQIRGAVCFRKHSVRVLHIHL